MKTSNIIITAIIGIVLAFFTGAYVGTHFERVHHENWFGKIDKAYINYLEKTNKNVGEKWKACQEEVFELQDKNLLMPAKIQDSLQRVMDNTILDKIATLELAKKEKEEKETKLEELGPAKMGNLDSLTDEQVELFAKELERGNTSVIDLLIARDMIKKHK